MIPLASKLLAATIIITLAMPLHAQSDVYTFDDPEKEALYKTLVYELRCLVCQNQNLADSNAELAQDLRRKSYEMVSRGDSYDEIIAFMVERYGDFVTYRPPLKASTLLLWAAPFLALLTALIVAFVRIRKSRSNRARMLDPSEAEQIDQLLDDR